MKYLITIGLLISFATFSGQSLNSIKRNVEAINKTENFDVKTVPNEYFLDHHQVTDNGIELKGFYKNGKLRKMEHFMGLSAWKITTEYFFSENEKLMFVYSKKYQTADENGYLKKPKLVSEVRDYFENNKLIKSVGKLDPDKEDYLKNAQKLINDLMAYHRY